MGFLIFLCLGLTLILAICSRSQIIVDFWLIDVGFYILILTLQSLLFLVKTKPIGIGCHGQISGAILAGSCKTGQESFY